jgi:hypothetical protein
MSGVTARRTEWMVARSSHVASVDHIRVIRHVITGERM